MDAEMFPLDSRVQRQWRLEAVVFSAVAATVILLAAAFLPFTAAARFGLAIVVVVAGAMALQFVVGLRYRYWRYGLAEDVLILQRGVWTRRRSMTPYFRVQNVDITQGPLERWLGLKRLTIRTASAFTDASIPGLDAADAENLRIRILERAGRDAAV
ncbi:MAG: PH domain-containing protein [Acidimicrobiia bacterium]|nr:PH domain-containing protein [Acidimicrobiia bacterium]